MTLVDLKSTLQKLLDDDTIDIRLNDISVSDSEILNTKLLNGKRLVYPYPTDVFFRINISDINQDFISFNLKEFNTCCGKLILHGIRYTDAYNDYKDKMKGKELSKELFKEAINLIFSSLVEIMEGLDYSSLSFIVSEMEQKKLFEILTHLGYKPVNSFSNKRMPLKNKCHEYIINLENS